MNEIPKKRGRPREFDPSVALVSAGQTFLRHGYAGTSLETLASEMHLNKPSLYAVFGDKHALYMRVLQTRAQMVSERYQQAFERGQTLDESLRHLFEEAVEVSLGEGGPPGCPIAAATMTEGLVDPEVGEFTKQFRARTDKGLARFIRSRRPSNGKTSTEALGRLTNGLLHDLAMRARVGESRAKLREVARDSANLIAYAAAEPADQD